MNDDHEMPIPFTEKIPTLPPRLILILGGARSGKSAFAVRQASELADVLLLDCITLWLGNVLLQESGHPEKDNEAEFHTASKLFDERALKEIEALLAVVKSLAPRKTLIAVTNEVGLGIVPAYPLGILYRDTLGYVNQRLAQAADRVYLMVAGIAIDIKRLREEASLSSGLS